MQTHFPTKTPMCHDMTSPTGMHSLRQLAPSSRNAPSPRRSNTRCGWLHSTQPRRTRTYSVNFPSHSGPPLSHQQVTLPTMHHINCLLVAGPLTVVVVNSRCCRALEDVHSCAPKRHSNLDWGAHARGPQTPEQHSPPLSVPPRVIPDLQGCVQDLPWCPSWLLPSDLWG